MKNTDCSISRGDLVPDLRNRSDRRIELNTTEARGGKPVGAMRWVLGIGLAGIIIAFIAVWLLVPR
jgi:hypothetical protein